MEGKRRVELTTGAHKEQKRGHFLSQKQSHRREITLAPEFHGEDFDRNMKVKRCARYRAKIRVECN